MHAKSCVHNTTTGRVAPENPGWVQFENGFYLPFIQNGVRVVHEL